MGINANDKHSNADAKAVDLLKTVLDNVICGILDGKSFELQFINTENISTELGEEFPFLCRYNFRLLDPAEVIKNESETLSNFYDDACADDDDGCNDTETSNSTKDIAKTYEEVYEELATIQTQIRQLYGALKNNLYV